MAVQKTTSRKKEEINKELAGAKKLLETARKNYNNKAEQVKQAEIDLQKAKRDVENLKKATGGKWQQRQREVERLQKRLETLRTEKKALGKEVTNKKYYVNRLNNELTLPFKEVKKQTKEDAQKAGKAKGKTKELEDQLKLLRGLRDKYTKSDDPMRVSIEKQIALKEKQLHDLTSPKKTVTRKKTEEKRVPEDIEKIAKEKGLDVRALKDSKGNSIYAFYDSKSSTMLQDGGYEGIITAKAAQTHSQYMEIGSDKKMNELLGDALKEEVKKGDFSNIIDDMNKRYELTEKVKFRVEDHDLSDIKPVPEPKQEKPKQQEPTIRLIPKTRRNGKPSKRNFEGIELTDVDGNKFVLTKKMMKDAVKNGNLAMTKDQRGEYNWDTYIEAAKNTEWNKAHPDDKKGPELTPESVASFFKDNEQKPNMLTDEQKAEAAKTAEYAKMKMVISGRE